MSLHATCQFIGPDQDPIRDYPVMMCGCKSLAGKSYCGEHYWRIYEKGSAVNGRRAEKSLEAEIKELEALQDLDPEIELETEND
jgi:hypothetical protein